MTYSIGVRDQVDKTFEKLRKRDRKQMEMIDKKLAEISENPYKFKPLRNPKQGLRRVHAGSFVITYSINEVNKEVVIEDYAHHDEIY
jgi:mRNA-degrading endonuclease RelE of RelBE toxin-antitoxin system